MRQPSESFPVRPPRAHRRAYCARRAGHSRWTDRGGTRPLDLSEPELPGGWDWGGQDSSVKPGPLWGVLGRALQPGGQGPVLGTHVRRLSWRGKKPPCFSKGLLTASEQSRHAALGGGGFPPCSPALPRHPGVLGLSGRGSQRAWARDSARLGRHGAAGTRTGLLGRALTFPQCRHLPSWRRRCTQWCRTKVGWQRRGAKLR